MARTSRTQLGAMVGLYLGALVFGLSCGRSNDTAPADEVTAQSDAAVQGELAITSGTQDTLCIRDATATYTGQMCTANDVRISGYTKLAGPDSCLPGETITVTLKATIESGPDRYDIGLWVDQQGFDAKSAVGFCSGPPENTACSATRPCPTGQTCLSEANRDRCFRDYLQPISTTNTNVDLKGGSGPFFNGELSVTADSCGDVPSASGWGVATDLKPCSGGGGTCVYTYYTFTASITCADTDNSGQADVGTCTSWDNSATTTKSGQACTSGNWPTMTLPGTSSKCNCGRVDIGGLKTEKTGTITVKKVVSPSTDTGKFSLQIDGTSSASDIGNGGSTGAVTVSAGTQPPGTGDTHSVGEVAGTGTTLADYATAISCADDKGNTASASSAGPLSFTVLPDANWVCTVTNTLKSSSLSLTKSASPTTYSVLGTTISYTYVLENTGAGTLSAPYAVTDDKAAVSCPATPATLAPGATVTCLASYVITQADLDAGSVTNHATATATFHGTTVTSNQAQATIHAAADPKLQLVKTATPASYSGVGDLISYSYELENTGNVTLSPPYSIADDKIAATCSSSATLAPGATTTCSGTYTITQADLDAGSVTNVATASATFGGKPVQSNQDTETVTAVQTPSIALTKVADPTTFSKVGDVISYTLVATNDGNVTLSGVSISDPKLGTLSCNPAQPAALAPGAALTCTGTYGIVQADLDAGKLDNTGTATGTGPTGQPVSDQASASVGATQNPHLSLTKTAAESSFGAAGNVLHYNLVATNDGNVTLHDVSITDPKLGTLTCTPAQPAILAPGETLSCTGSYTVSQSDVDAGKLDNTAAVNGTGPAPDNKPVSAVAAASVPAAQGPKLSLTKTPSPTSFEHAGDVITYTLVATNIGNVTLTDVVISDPLLSTLTCTPAQPATLAPTASMTCTGSYTARQADVDAGQIDNTATVAGHPPVGEAITATASAHVPATSRPNILLSKTAMPTHFSAVGQVITYGLLATNVGNVTLTDVVISDPKLAGLVCTPALPATLAPTASVSCAGNYTITQADLDAGTVTNLALVTAQPPQGEPVGNSATATVIGDQAPALALTKAADLTSYSYVGEVITYTLVAANTGNVTLDDVSIFDASLPALTCIPLQPATLAPGAALTCTGSHTITQADLDAGNVYNAAGATGRTPGGGTIGSPPATEDVPAVQNPHLTLAKSADPTTFSKVGDVIAYTLVASNDGNVTLSNVSITDEKVGALTCTPAQPASLAPGAALSCTGSHTITQADLDAGRFDNTAAASGTGPKGQPVSDEASATTTATQSPHLSLTKTATEPSFGAAGNVLHYTVVATNDGNVTLHDVSISDPKLGTLTCTQPAILAPGETLTCTGSYTVTQSDVDAGKLDNTATASGTGPQDQPVSAEASASVPASRTPSLSLRKTPSPTGFESAGDVITYALVATNTGNVTLTDVAIFDPMLGTLTCTPVQPATLAPGATLTCTGSYAAKQSDVDAGQIDNTASVAGHPPVGEPVTATASAHVPATSRPNILLAKAADTAVYDHVGQVITYTLLATNVGNVTLTNVVISDPKLSGLACTPALPATLAPKASLSCAGTYTITQADLDVGTVTNLAFVTAQPPQGQPIGNSDTVTVPGDRRAALALAKSADLPSYSAVGEVITYTLVATNAGNVTLTGVEISDPSLILTCTPLQPATLAPGAALTCTGSHTITQADLDAGNVYNAATANGTSPLGPLPPVSDDLTVPGLQGPSLALTKTASPTLYSAAGQVITYSYVLTNTGNVTLAAPFAVSDDKATVTCTPATSLAPGATLSCNAAYTIQAGDVSATYDGSVTNHATASAAFGATTVLSNQATATVRQTKPAAQIAPTATTCEQYASGTSPTLLEALYNVKGRTINSVAPGVAFYYATIVPTSSSFSLVVSQSNLLSWKPMPIQDLGQVILWDSSCNKAGALTTGYDAATGEVTTHVQGVNANAVYYLSVKYVPSGVAGQAVKSPYPRDPYTFKVLIDGTAQPFSDATLTLVPKR